MGKVSKQISESANILNLLLVIGFLGIVWLMIYGNLSSNLGFATSTTGYNNTESVISNVTQGVGTFFTFSNTFFTITAIVLLITILLGLLGIVLNIVKATKSKGDGFAG